MAKYDIPATIDVILNISSVLSLSYIGHSQGSTIGFAEFSRDQGLLSKVDIFIALAPVTYVANTESPIKYLAYISDELQFLFFILGIRDFNLPPQLQEYLAELACDDPLGRKICANVVFLFAGYDEAQLNETRLPVYGAHGSAGSSVKDLVHWAQLVRSKKFCMYDYGPWGNEKHYGQHTQPPYILSDIHVPTALFTGGRDLVADPKDVAILIPQLKNIVYRKHIGAWDHLDFILGLDAPRLVYSKVINLLRKYSRINEQGANTL